MIKLLAIVALLSPVLAVGQMVVKSDVVQGRPTLTLKSGASTLSLPSSGTDTLAGRITTDTFENKTISTALNSILGTAGRVPIFNAATGALESSSTTSTQLSYLSTLTGNVQTQLNGKQAAGDYITGLSGDVSATGPNNAPATVLKVGGSDAANVAAQEARLRTGVTSPGVVVNNGSNVLSAIAPGALGNILTSNGSAWVSAPGAGGGGLSTTLQDGFIYVGDATDTAQAVAVSGDVTLANDGTVTVDSVGGSTAADIATAEALANAATPLNTADAIVLRDNNGDFAAGTITADLAGDVTGDVTGNLTGNVTGDVTGDLTGNVTGNVTGDLTGDVTGNLTGNVTGDVTGDLTGSVTGAASLNVLKAGDEMSGPLTFGGAYNVNAGSQDMQAISATAIGSFSEGGILGTTPGGAYLWGVGGDLGGTAGLILHGGGSNLSQMLLRDGTTVVGNTFNINSTSITAGADFVVQDKTAGASTKMVVQAGPTQGTTNLLEFQGPNANVNGGTALSAIEANGKFAFPLGDAATPGLHPFGDANTGIYSSGGDSLSASIGGTRQLELDSTGLAVGDISPSEALDVDGDARIRGLTNEGPVTADANGVLSSTALTNGQLLIGSTGAAPVAATLTAGSNITITNTAGSIEIAASGGGGTTYAWSGYHGADCLWTFNSTSFATPTADSTCAFTEVENENFGTVSSWVSGSDKLPGFVFTPPVTGIYQVCATTKASHYGSDGDLMVFELSEAGGTVMSTAEASGYSGSVKRHTLPNCGLYRGTAATPATIRIRGKISADNAQVTSSQSRSTIEWTIFKVN